MRPNADPASSDRPSQDAIRVLTSIDGVNTPPSGRKLMKFSFPNPEPSVEFEGFLFAFEVITFTNSYSIDPSVVEIRRDHGSLVLEAAGFRWAGGSEPAEGRLTAELVADGDGGITWSVSATLAEEIKSVKTIVRGLPGGRVSAGAENWEETALDERVWEYPALGAGGISTPLLVIHEDDDRYWAVSADQIGVRAARFALSPGEQGYRTELVYEAGGWENLTTVKTTSWRIAHGRTFEEVAGAHFERVRATYSIEAFADRRDVPGWMRSIALVLSLHGEHWTGYVHLSFEQQLDILRWVAAKIDPAQVMVYLPGWDGRYYWDYPVFEAGPRPGGEAGLRRLIDEGHRLGFHFALMFGSNIANPRWSGFASIEGAQAKTLYGLPFASDYVDWDGDRAGEPSMVFMNLAVESWRDLLVSRITDAIDRYGIDAYFLDIFGMWVNNREGDIFEGGRALIQTLAETRPGVAPIGEMLYDAQMGFVPLNHVPRFPLISRESYAVSPSFSHLSHPAFGEGSSGVHEIGFQPPRLVTVDQDTIPTLTFVRDTLDRHSEELEIAIRVARERFSRRGRRTDGTA